MEVLDPTAELSPVPRKGSPRLSRLENMTVGLLDISKPRGDVFLNRLAELLAARSVTVRRYSKPTHARPAPRQLVTQISSECDAVVEALAD